MATAASLVRRHPLLAVLQANGIGVGFVNGRRQGVHVGHCQPGELYIAGQANVCEFYYGQLGGFELRAIGLRPVRFRLNEEGIFHEEQCRMRAYCLRNCAASREFLRRLRVD